MSKNTLLTIPIRTNQRTVPHSPTQVGNGHFAFGADIMGLQTFVPFSTMSDWGWHSGCTSLPDKGHDIDAVIDLHFPLAFKFTMETAGILLDYLLI